MVSTVLWHTGDVCVPWRTLQIIAVIWRMCVSNIFVPSLRARVPGKEATLHGHCNLVESLRHFLALRQLPQPTGCHSIVNIRRYEAFGIGIYCRTESVESVTIRRRSQLQYSAFVPNSVLTSHCTISSNTSCTSKLLLSSFTKLNHHLHACIVSSLAFQSLQNAGRCPSQSIDLHSANRARIPPRLRRTTAPAVRFHPSTTPPERPTIELHRPKIWGATMGPATAGVQPNVYCGSEPRQPSQPESSQGDLPTCNSYCMHR